MSESPKGTTRLTRQDMAYELAEVYNRSFRIGRLTPELLSEVLTQVGFWRAALNERNPDEQVRASETFKALTQCLCRGQSYADAQGRLIETLPLGRPQLENALWHLRQLAYRPGATDRETLEALNEVLLEADSSAGVAAGDRPADSGQDKPKGTGEGPRREVGRPTKADRAKNDIELAQQMRVEEQIVDRLIREAGDNHKWKAALVRLKKDRQFVEQVNEAGLSLDDNLAARARRKLNPRRK